MISPEAQWLIGMELDRAPRACRQIDWPKLVALAHQEGATPVLCQSMQRAPHPSLPQDLAARLRTLAVIADFQLLHLQRALHDVLDRLAGAGIDVMLLKGSALAHTAYRAPAHRPMGDLDVLVRPERAIDAWSLLQRHGWSWPATSWPADRYAEHQHLPPLVRRGADTLLEIHGALLPSGHPFRWPLDGVWARARRITVAGRAALVPEPLDQLLHVCVHFAWSHEMHWGSWRALRDVTAISRDDFPWRRFVELARETKATTCCFWTLRLARALAGARVPDEVLSALQPPRPEFVLKRLEYHYAGQLFAGERGCPSEALNRALWELGIAPRWSRHGAVRPWHGADRWATPRTPAPRPRGLWREARHAAAALGYLGRITASRSPHPA